MEMDEVIDEERDGSTASALDTVSVGASGTTRRDLLVLTGIMFAAAFLYFSIYNPSRIGEHHDDSMYIATAKALAKGQGYRIISLPYEPAQTKYPPFYPFMLSLIWRVYPDFPRNVNAMVGMSAIATLIFLTMTWRYLVSFRYASSGLALLVVAITALNWRTVIVATGLFSEMPYAALSVVGLFLAEKLERTRGGWVTGLALGLVVGLTFLTRSTGITLLMALPVYLVLRRKVRLALLPLAVGGLFVVGWFAWCYANRTMVTGVNVAWYTNYLAHFGNVLKDVQANTHSSMPLTILSVVSRNFLMVVVLSIPLLCLGLDYSWIVYLGFALMFIAAGFIRDVSRGWRLLHVYIVCYLALHVVWLPFVSYDRYLLPILPFLLLWLVREIETITSLARKTLASDRAVTQQAGAAVKGLALVAMVSVAIYNYGSSLYYSLASAPFSKKVKPAADDAEAIEWIQANTDPSDVLACSRDPVYYLYTGRKATRSLPMKGAGPYWEGTLLLVFDIADESNAKYLVLTASDFQESYQPDLQTKSLKDLIEEHREKFVPVFNSATGRTTVYQITSVAARP